jgi:hypothetical protein
VRRHRLGFPIGPSDCGGGTRKRVCGCGADMPCLIGNNLKPDERAADAG